MKNPTYRIISPYRSIWYTRVHAQDLLFDYRLVQERCDGGDAIKRMTPEERMKLLKKTLKKSNKLTQKLLRKLDREWDEVFKEDDGNYY